mmetsp:Transcript_3524/g.5895  ORF Transcript_3524/g.5895 Transcript_3524/m.5895 type:complete len:207 (-) Transcript_3524:2006-2626(-)
MLWPRIKRAVVLPLPVLLPQSVPHRQLVDNNTVRRVVVVRRLPRSVPQRRLVDNNTVRQVVVVLLLVVRNSAPTFAISKMRFPPRPVPTMLPSHRAVPFAVLHQEEEEEALWRKMMLPPRCGPLGASTNRVVSCRKHPVKKMMGRVSQTPPRCNEWKMKPLPKIVVDQRLLLLSPLLRRLPPPRLPLTAKTLPVLLLLQQTKPLLP